MLAIDTATASCSIALGQNGELVGEETFAAGRSHLELLLPAIDRLLTANAISLSELRAIAVGTGPGTFSGLRVGVATARGLAQGLRVRLSGSSSLDALAAHLATAGSARRLLPVIDAKRGQVFSRLFGLDDAGKPVPQSEIMCLSPADLLTTVSRERIDGGVLAGGDGVLAYYDIFTADAGVDVPAPDDIRHEIRARYHLRAAGSSTGSCDQGIEVLPVYVREPDADKTVLLRKREPWLE